MKFDSSRSWERGHRAGTRWRQTVTTRAFAVALVTVLLLAGNCPPAVLAQGENDAICAEILTNAELATLPYRVAILLDWDPAAGDSAMAADRLHDRLDQYFGQAWQATLHVSTGGFNDHVSTADSSSDPFREATGMSGSLPDQAATLVGDKVLIAKVRAVRNRRGDILPRLRLTVIEFDRVLDDWGPIAGRQVAKDQPGLLVDELARLLARQFRPRGLVLRREARLRVDLAVQGMALQPADSAFDVVSHGTCLTLHREFHAKGEELSRLLVPWTYLIVSEAKPFRLSVEADVLSGLRNPISSRTRGGSRMWALGLGQLDQPRTVMTFLEGTETDARPVVGQEVVARPFGARASVRIGATDRHGRVIVPPARLPGEPALRRPRVQTVTLRSGSLVLASFPLVPGAIRDATLRVRTDPLLVELSGRLLALEEQVVDQAARRALLRRQLDAWADANDLPRAREVAAAINALPTKEAYLGRLAELEREVQERLREKQRDEPTRAMRQLFDRARGTIDKGIIDDEVTVEHAAP